MEQLILYKLKQCLKRGGGLVKESVKQGEIGRTGRSHLNQIYLWVYFMFVYFYIMSVLLFITAQGNDWRGNALSRWHWCIAWEMSFESWRKIMLQNTLTSLKEESNIYK